MAIGLDADETVARMLDEPTLETGVSLSSLGRSVIALGAVLALGATLAIGWASLQSGASATAADEPTAPLPVRRDAVRALAIEVGAIDALGGEGDSPVPSDAESEPAPGPPEP